MAQLFITALVFVLLSGLMSLTEAAVLSVTTAEVEAMVHRGLRGARRLRELKHRLTSAVVVLVVFTNTINVLGPVLVGTLAVEVYGSSVLGAVTALLTFGTIVFSEIVPKSLGTHYATRISRLVAPALRALTILFLPVVWLFERLTGALKVGERRVGTEDQIRSLVRIGHSAGYIETDETQMVQRVFQLNDRSAQDIMTPKAMVISVDPSATVSEAATVVAASPYTRFPIMAEGRVLGVVISHDLLRSLNEGRSDQPVTDMMHPPMEVDASTRADDLLVLFRARRFHLAVVEKHGEAVGVVTLEDVLEEIVGEIADEKE